MATLETGQHVAVNDVDGSLVDYRGYEIPAPGFDRESFARAIDRALAEGVRLAPTGRTGTFHATRQGSAATYTTTRAACSCRAGQRGGACKHRALACLLLTIHPARPP